MKYHGGGDSSPYSWNFTHHHSAQRNTTGASFLKKYNTGIFHPLQRLQCFQNVVFILFVLAEYSELDPGPVNVLYTSSAATF